MAQPALVQIGANGEVAAGEFSAWLRDTAAALRSGSKATDVPCGTCRGCCRSSMFIHIGPGEVETIRRIPRALLFPAPGLPKGHVLMGYGDRGECPMLVDGECSIYEFRPRTCRDYDCRVFAATGVAVEEHSQPEIAERVRAWRFRYDNGARSLEAALRRAAAFLKDQRDTFPAGSLPVQPGALAATAVRIAEFFTAPFANLTDAEIRRRIMAVVRRGRASRRLPPGAAL